LHTTMNSTNENIVVFVRILGEMGSDVYLLHFFDNIGLKTQPFEIIDS